MESRRKLLLSPEDENREADIAPTRHLPALWIGNIESDGSYGEGFRYVWGESGQLPLFCDAGAARSEG